MGCRFELQSLGYCFLSPKITLRHSTDHVVETWIEDTDNTEILAIVIWQLGLHLMQTFWHLLFILESCNVWWQPLEFCSERLQCLSHIILTHPFCTLSLCEYSELNMILQGGGVVSLHVRYQECTYSLIITDKHERMQFTVEWLQSGPRVHYNSYRSRKLCHGTVHLTVCAVSVIAAHV